jgi:UDP-perosamine 4-acetyltransferase
MLGAGGHARVLQELLAEKGHTLHGYVAPAEDASFESQWLGGDDTFAALNPVDYLLLNGVGSIGATKVRAKVFANYKKLGFNFLTIESNDSIVAPSAVVLEGVQVMRGAVINTAAIVEENSIINTGAIVEHDNLIGQNCHVSVGATLCGDVRVGSGTHIGAGATVIQGVKIGQNCIIGAGATVIADVPDNHTAVGVPAKNRPNKA